MKSPFLVKYHSPSELNTLRDDKQIFALIHYGQKTTISHDSGAEIQIGLPVMDENIVEAWYSHEPISYETHKQVHYQYSDTFIFGSLLINESDFPDLATATISAYQQIHDVLEMTGFPGLLRMWNFFPEINAKDAQGMERYKQFCLGRHTAIDSWHFVDGQLPAATAIGSHSDGLLILFLSARQSGIQIENPRQVSAFHYPTQYGPKSPSFSRATLKNWGKSQHLYISGTASIVGHETRHQNNYLAQLEETLTNIHAVIDQAHQLHGLPCKDISELNSMRVFIREPEIYQPVLEFLEKEIGRHSHIQIVQGDICRNNLLLEIEGLYTSPG